MIHRYTVVLERDPEEGGYTVTVPALPGCITEADTVGESLDMAKEAIGATSNRCLCWGRNLPLMCRRYSFNWGIQMRSWYTKLQHD